MYQSKTQNSKLKNKNLSLMCNKNLRKSMKNSSQIQDRVYLKQRKWPKPQDELKKALFRAMYFVVVTN